ncbi:MAG: NAD-dependent epimerase/dehydratase [Microbacterium sp.]|nr:NAD-dependent epimerase/dehydratase [Microbacterium sp.]
MSRVVVTGGAGRLGRSLVGGLVAAGHRVVSFDRAVSDAPELQGADQLAIDLLDAEATAAALRAQRATAVIHLAAIAVPFSAPEDVIMRTNAALAVSVLGGAVTAGIPRVVAASSPTVLGYGAPRGWVPDRFPLDEDPCYVIAPEEWRGAPTQQGHTVRERLDDPALAAPALFNYVDARDVASFADTLLAALPTIPNAETFFVGADDALARHPLAELIPRFHPGTHEVAAVLTGTTPAFSNEKARRLLGWAPRHSWRDALADDPSLTDTRKDVPA